MPNIRIEIVYALAQAQDIVRLELRPGTTAGEAVAASGLRARHAVVAAGCQLGLAGRRIPENYRPRDGDRIELLRPLLADPKDARKSRARKTRRS